MASTSARKRRRFQTIYRPNWGGPGWRYIDVTAMVQEIVDRAGWVSGNALSILLIGGGAFPAGEFRIEALENVGTNHARITIDSGATGNLYLREHPSGAAARPVRDLPRLHGRPALPLPPAEHDGGRGLGDLPPAAGAERARDRLRRPHQPAHQRRDERRGDGRRADDGTGGRDDHVHPRRLDDPRLLHRGLHGLRRRRGARGVRHALPVAGGGRRRRVDHGERRDADPGPPRGRHGAGGGAKMVYSDKVGGCGTAADLFDSTFTSTWSAPGAAAVTDPPYEGWWKLLRVKPDYSRLAVVARDCGGGGRPTIRVSFWDGANWDYPGGGLQDSFDATITHGRPEASVNRSYDAAYESLSGRLLIVSGYQTITTIPLLGLGRLLLGPRLRLRGLDGYRRRHLQLGAAGAHPRTNKIVFAGTSSTGDGRVAVWNGDTDTWTVAEKIGMGLRGEYRRGRLRRRGRPRRAAGGRGGGGLRPGQHHPLPRLPGERPDALLDGLAIAVTLGAATTRIWLRLRSDDAGNLVLGIETVNEEIRTLTYNGGTRTWGTVSGALSTTAFGNADDNRPFDLVFDRAAGPDAPSSPTPTPPASSTAARPTAGPRGAPSRRSTTLAPPTGSAWSPSRAGSSTWRSPTRTTTCRRGPGTARRGSSRRPRPISSDLEVNTQTTSTTSSPSG